MINDDFEIKTEKINLNIEVPSNTINYKANENYLGLGYFNLIKFYNLEKKRPNENEYFKLKIVFNLFELNQKYPNVLLITNKSFIELFELPNKFNNSTIELNPIVKYKPHENSISSVIFNPRYSHIIAILSNYNNINLHIWDNTKFNNQITSFKKFQYNFKWEEKGFLYGLCEEKKIKIYNRKERRMIYTYEDNNLFDYNFLDENNIAIISEKSIIIFSLIELNKINEININFSFLGFLKTNDFFIFNLFQSLIFYNIGDKELKYYGEQNFQNKFDNLILVKDKYDNNNNLIIEIFAINKWDFNLIIISDENKNLEEKNDDIQNLELINESKSINARIFNVNIKNENNNFCFKKELNQKNKNEKEIIEVNKDNLKINKETSNNDNKNEEIIREENKNENKIEEENKIIIDDKYKKEEEVEKDEEILNDIKDNINENYFQRCLMYITDITELLKYSNNEEENNFFLNKKKLYFEIDIIQKDLKQQSKSLIDLKNYVNKVVEKELESKKFKDINEEYLFYIELLIKDDTNKKLLIKYLKLLKNIEENNIKLNYPHEKYNDEFNYYLPLLDKNDIINEFGYKNFKSEKEKVKDLLKNIKYSIENETFNKLKNELEEIDFIYNQPFPLNTDENIFFRCRIYIIDIIKNVEYKQNKKLEFIKYIIDKILDNKIVENIHSPNKILLLINYMDKKEEKNEFDFFFNLINSKQIEDNKIKEKLKNINIYNCDSPKDLCIENIILNNETKKGYELSELYNFEYLCKHPPLNIDIDKIKKFLKITLKSNVFKELFILLTGRKDYDEIFNSNMISYIIDNIQFIPLNYTETSAFIDKLSLTTYIPTMKKVIFQSSNHEKKQIIYKTLENGIIIEIEFHEIGHTISAVLSFVEKSNSLINTPRKKNLNVNEGGYYVEMALFGRIIKVLTYKEALYILNLNNYNKTLKEFRKDFESVNNGEDLFINGPFEDLNIEKKKEKKNEYENNKYEEYNFSICSKNNLKDEDILKEYKIMIPLKNDIKRNDLKLEDILSYT